jgi:hypothetical protein
MAARYRIAQPALKGRGVIKRRNRTVVTVRYAVHFDPANCQASVVKFSRKPPLRAGELVHLTLEDRRVLSCRVLDESPYCAVIGDGPIGGALRATSNSPWF